MLNQETITSHPVWRRDWRNYSKELLDNALNLNDLNFKSDSLQAYWNELETQLIRVVDDLVPLTQFINDNIPMPIPIAIKD